MAKKEIRAMRERFQHSGETISRHFNETLLCISNMAKNIIKPLDPEFSQVPPYILHDKKYMPHFKDCIGAIDGTHIHACVPAKEQIPYIGRKGFPTQNVMAVCDFNMCFTFVSAGWEGSAHDARVFYDALRKPEMNFPHPPNGKYYLVDAGYPNVKGYLGPYRGKKYHLPDFRLANGPVGRKEIFNKRHSSLRNIIERTFGVWKKKWAILRDMPSYSLDKQVKIVVATMVLHNYIRRHVGQDDIDFTVMEDQQEYYEHEGGSTSNGTGNTNNLNDSTYMTQLREIITDSLLS